MHICRFSLQLYVLTSSADLSQGDRRREDLLSDLYNTILNVFPRQRWTCGMAILPNGPVVEKTDKKISSFYFSTIGTSFKE